MTTWHGEMKYCECYSLGWTLRALCCYGDSSNGVVCCYGYRRSNLASGSPEACPSVKTVEARKRWSSSSDKENFTPTAVPDSPTRLWVLGEGGTNTQTYTPANGCRNQQRWSLCGLINTRTTWLMYKPQYTHIWYNHLVMCKWIRSIHVLEPSVSELLYRAGVTRQPPRGEKRYVYLNTKSGKYGFKLQVRCSQYADT